MGEQFALISKSSVELRDMFPEMKVLKDAFGKGFNSTTGNIINVKSILTDMLESLLGNKKEILTLVYGLEGKTTMTIEEIEKEKTSFDFLEKDDNVTSIVRRGIKRLSIPSISDKITKKKLPYYSNNFFISSLKEELCDDIEHMILKKDEKDAVYLPRIFKNYNIEVADYKYIPDISIEELDLSVRAFNCLKRVGINTAKDFLELYEKDDVQKMIPLEKKSFDETIEKLTGLGYLKKGCSFITLMYGGEKIIYKFYNANQEEISESILDEIIAHKRKCHVIFRNELYSHGLIRILLMKGYLYDEDVVKDSEKLIEEFKAFGLEEHALEIKKFANWYNSTGEYEKVYVCFNEQIVNYIQNNNITRYDELVKYVEEENEEEMLSVMNEAKKALE